MMTVNENNYWDEYLKLITIEKYRYQVFLLLEGN